MQVFCSMERVGQLVLGVARHRQTMKQGRDGVAGD